MHEKRCAGRTLLWHEDKSQRTTSLASSFSRLTDRRASHSRCCIVSLTLVSGEIFLQIEWTKSASRASKSLKSTKAHAKSWRKTSIERENLKLNSIFLFIFPLRLSSKEISVPLGEDIKYKDKVSSIGIKSFSTRKTIGAQVWESMKTLSN